MSKNLSQQVVLDRRGFVAATFATVAGKPFGSKEPYGIGLPLDSDGVAFVNDFLKKIEDDGTWTELWQICIGDRTGDTNVPELPEIGA